MAAPTSVSICLCTYNGERYLGELLASLSAQLVTPDELVVCDDASEDRTGELVREYARTAPFAVRFLVNPERLGIVRNFERSVREATGAILLICDQDDIWHADKVKVVADAFAERPALAGAFHNAKLIDGEGRPLPGSLWDQSAFRPRDLQAIRGGRGLSYLARHPRIAGHTLALSALAKPLLLPFSANAAYDNWIPPLLCASGPFEPIEDELVSHRLHSDNAVGVWRSKTLGDRLGRSEEVSRLYRTEAAGVRDLILRLEQERPTALTSRIRRDLAGKEAHLERRARFHDPSRRSFGDRARHCGGIVGETATLGYSRFSNGLSSAAFDLAAALLPAR